MFFWDAFPHNRLLVEASLWSADFTRFANEMGRMEPFADLYHIEVSDGHPDWCKGRGSLALNLPAPTVYACLDRLHWPARQG